MDDIREDQLPEQAPASEGTKQKGQASEPLVGPESETRGGPEAPDDALDEACGKC